MQFVSNDFNILKVNGSILIIEKMWKKSLVHFNVYHVDSWRNVKKITNPL
jgi:hypothetical protein